MPRHAGLCEDRPREDHGLGVRIVKQLTGLDASFLYMETPTMFGHVNGLAIYQRPTPDFDPFDLVYKRFEGMIGRARADAAAPRRGADAARPSVLDRRPDFDLDYHVRHIGLAPPGAADQLAEQVARIVGRPMDRSPPVVGGAMSSRASPTDGGRCSPRRTTPPSTAPPGVILLNMLTDTDPDASNTLDPVPWTRRADPDRPRAAAD